MTQAFIEIPYEVQKPQSGLRLDRFLALRLPHRSRGKIQLLIEEGKVFLNGSPARASRRVKAGERVSLRFLPRPEPPCEVERLDVLYHDSDILAVDKPAGLLSHPTGKTALNAATAVLKGQFPGIVPRLIHRLDRDTSGVLLLACSSRAAARMQRAFLRREVRKEYLAIVRGQVLFKKLTVDIPLGREGSRGLGIYVRQCPGEGAPAVTDLERAGSGEKFSLLRARPRTGRLHQIRAHLSFLGHPVAFDKLYEGAGEAYLEMVRTQGMGDRGARQMLHAHRISFAHPSGSGTVEIRSPLPADFREFLSQAGLLELP